MIPDIVSVAQTKASLSQLVKEARKGKIFEVVSRSQPMAILIGVEQYKDLLERLEDLEDAVAVLVGRLEDQGQPPLPWEQVLEEYRKQHPEADV